MKILIIDDNLTNRLILKAMLLPYGDIILATNGSEGIAAFNEALDSGVPYDLICLDIMMPEIDGIETLRRVREIENRSGIIGLSGVKVIMITALSDSTNIKISFREQCEAYIVKPVKLEILIKRIKQLGLIASS
jgi:two-component system chemotaxis response regulator CheY